MEITIYTDGASRGNPGKSSYGFVIFDKSGKEIFSEGKYLGIQTNNFAEYSAILASLQYVKGNLGVSENIIINFLMDSKLAVEQLSGNFKVKNLRIKQFFSEITNITKDFKHVTYKHIPRVQNFHADSLANKALDSL